MFIIGLSLNRIGDSKKVLKHNINIRKSVKSTIITDIYIIPQYFEKCYRKITKKAVQQRGFIERRFCII